MTEDFLQKLLVQYHVPVHILKHMQKVAAVSLYLGQRLKQKGENINLVVLRQAALLHDILKLCDFKKMDLEHFDQNITAEDIQFWTALMKSCSHIGHVDAAYNMLKEAGEDELATIIQKHRFEGIIDEKEKPKTWEEKILYYADKRVKHDQIVSINERLNDGRNRYFPDGNLPPNDHLIEKAIYELENEICTAIETQPENITEEEVHPFLENSI